MLQNILVGRYAGDMKHQQQPHNQIGKFAKNSRTRMSEAFGFDTVSAAVCELEEAVGENNISTKQLACHFGRPDVRLQFSQRL